MFPDSSGEVTFKNINHYLPPRLYFAAGADKTPGQDSFNGQIAFVNINLGPGSFKVAPTYPDPTDKFGYERGIPKPDEKKPDEKKPDEKKPDEKKPDEKKPDEKKPDEKKPDEKKPDEKKPETGTTGGGDGGDAP
jgi:hypothetical protein